MIECSALRVAEPGDNHDGSPILAYGPVPIAGCHLEADHDEEHDFSPLPDVEHVGPLDLAEIETRIVSPIGLTQWERGPMLADGSTAPGRFETRAWGPPDAGD